MKAALVIAMSLVAGTASAACYGSKNFSTCQDNSGNNYTVQRYGNTTHMQGNNYQTGSSWSQDSNTFGNTTLHNGRDSNGNSWNTTCIHGRCF
jgi:hypothetical protein